MPAPVGHTCPDIDKVIKHLKSAIKNAEWGNRSSEKDSEQQYYFKEIISDLDDLQSIMEDLRRDNEQLRTWGKECEAQIEELEEQLNEIANA